MPELSAPERGAGSALYREQTFTITCWLCPFTDTASSEELARAAAHSHADKHPGDTR